MTRITPFLLASRLYPLCLLCLLFTRGALAQFEARGQPLVESSPWWVSVADFNNDGRADLAVAGTCCPWGAVSILLGNGDGTFGQEVNYIAGEAPLSIAVADFNLDGNLDLAVASYSEYIAILLGNGDGTFQPEAQTAPVPGIETFIGVADFNNDRKLDLVALGPNSTISVLLGNGDGTFQNAITTQPSFAVQALGIGDFNGDGKLDLVTAGQFGASSYVYILLGNGDGTFHVGESYMAENSPSSITVADFNGDHKLDFAVANFEGVGTGNVGVWIANGDGTFQQGVNYPTEFPQSVTSARLSGNGNLDLIVANYGTPGAGASVLTGNGDGTFQPAVFYPAGFESRHAAVGDFNGDKKPDIVVADTRTDYAIVLLNTGVVSFAPTTALNFKSQAVGTTSPPQTVTLTNNGTSELKIASIKPSAGFSVTSTCGKTVTAGADCTITATFSPSRKGAIQGTITIVDSASTKPQAIELLGTGT
ncbi:MAG TPA: FG-GAP-like repeat-containing protein [Candidatus Binatia bacterium]|nr:FG-GAP-like repeat-containing protein [Candidatus Binatia bacterium]